MNRQTNLKFTLKTLPLLSVLAIGLALSPTLATAESDRNHHKQKYSHDRGKSYNQHHDKGHRKNKHVYNQHGRTHGKHHNNRHGHKSKPHHNNWRSHSYSRNHYAHDNHQPVYVVNDHHYGHHYLDGLKFMIGLHTDNFDITFRD